MPLGIKVASAFFYVYAAIGLTWGFSYWYLIGQPHISWPLVGFYLVVALLFVWVGEISIEVEPSSGLAAFLACWPSLEDSTRSAVPHCL